jgi:hypothetical protein
MAAFNHHHSPAEAGLKKGGDMESMKSAALEADIERTKKFLIGEFDRGSKADLEFCRRMADEICPDVETHCDTVPFRISCVVAAKIAYLENATEDQSDCEYCGIYDRESKRSCKPT